MGHDCGNYHYGNMETVRPCCVEFALWVKDCAIKYALTDRHPAYVAFIEICDSLTDAERLIVGDCRYDFIIGGIIESPLVCDLT